MKEEQEKQVSRGRAEWNVGLWTSNEGGREIAGWAVAMVLAVISLVLVAQKPAQADTAWPSGDFVYSATDGDSYEIYKKENGTGTTTKLTNSSSTYYLEPAVSPKRDKVAFVGCPKTGGYYCNLYTVPYINGGSPTPLINKANVAWNYTVSSPAWSPDGSKIAFLGPQGIETVPAGGGVTTMLCATGTDTSTWRRGEPSWSPDGQWIAYFRYNANGANVYKTSATGNCSSPEYPLTSMPSESIDPLKLAEGDKIDWSPDGKNIAFSRKDRLYVIPSNLSVPAAASRVGDGREVAWAPDSSRIGFLYLTGPDCFLFCWGGPKAFEIHTAYPDGSNRTQITQLGGIQHSLDWGPRLTIVAPPVNPRP